MDRRDFLKRAALMSGAVVVGSRSADAFSDMSLLLAKQPKAWKSLTPVMLPNTITAETEDGTYDLVYDQGLHTCGDIVVHLRARENVLYTTLRSPSKPVKYFHSHIPVSTSRHQCNIHLLQSSFRIVQHRLIHHYQQSQSLF